ncbi:MAG: MBL fold metallo-hydrolase [Proteobacteria bacterium]|nr:MBL fold metallo-hydrolase [Pseudomonadota bacterium]
MAENKTKEEKTRQTVIQPDVQYSTPLPDVHVASLPIAGCAWIDTGDGVVLIDTLVHKRAAEETMAKIDGQIKTIIYTHGHVDHVGGTQAFMKDNPEIIANRYLADRLDSYKMLHRHRARISAQQWNIPDLPDLTLKVFEGYVYPTREIIGDYSFKLGNKSFEVHTARAETDDVCWVWVPEIKSAFIGDLVIGSFPNIGNPWKPTRFALDWAKELEKVRALNPENVFCNGAGLVYQGQAALDALDANIEVIRNLHDQVVALINEDMHISDMIYAVKIPEHLADSPYLQSAYSRVEFFVYNVYRWYHGYFDGNPAHLLPRPEREVNTELLGLIGQDRLMEKAEELLGQNKVQLALQVLDVLISAEPANKEARHMRIRILEILGQEDHCLMSKNTWIYFIDRDKALLASKES